MNPVKFFKEELIGFAGLFLPPFCPNCRTRPLQSSSPGLCGECLAALALIPSSCCKNCCLPFDGPPGTDHLCEDCLKTPPPFSGVIALGIYTGPLRDCVHRFKYEEAFYLHRPLGRLLAEAVAQKLNIERPKLVIPVPLHPTKLRKRTYNQSLLLARTIGKAFGLPVTARGLVRTRATPSQQGLRSEERKRNLKGAFSLREKVKGLRVLLVDDVLTTGATAGECSRVLLRGGARDVYVAVLARAPKLF